MAELRITWASSATPCPVFLLSDRTLFLYFIARTFNQKIKDIFDFVRYTCACKCYITDFCTNLRVVHNWYLCRACILMLPHFFSRAFIFCENLFLLICRNLFTWHIFPRARLFSFSIRSIDCYSCSCLSRLH